MPLEDDSINLNTRVQYTVLHTDVSLGGGSMKRIVSGIMSILLVLSVFSLLSYIQPVRAQGTIYIRADGSIDPPDAPISTDDSITYTFTGDIYDSIVIEMDNIVVDGQGYTLQGPASYPWAYESKGTDVTGRSNVTIQNTNIQNCWYGIYLNSSSNNSISGNNIAPNAYGVYLEYSSNYNSISGNNITANYNGIELGNSSDYNRISGNNITNNWMGIAFYFSSDINRISGNNITNNSRGIFLNSCSNNSVSGNNITANNEAGISLDSSSSNSIFHNNFINNAQQVYSSDSVNAWDDGYSSGGNYWSNYTGVDNYSGPNQDQPGSDRIGDTPYPIDTENRDGYPLMYPWRNKIGVRDIVHFDNISVIDGTNDVWMYQCFTIQQNFFLECGNGTIRWIQNVYEACWWETPPSRTIYVTQSAWIFTAYPGLDSEQIFNKSFADPSWSQTEAGMTPYVYLELNSFILGSLLMMSGLQAGNVTLYPYSRVADVGIGARIIDDPADPNVLAVPNWGWLPSNTRPQLVLVGYGGGSNATWGYPTSGWVEDYSAYSLVGGVPQWVQDNAADVVTNDNAQTGETSYNLGWGWGLGDRGQERGGFTYENSSIETGIASYTVPDVAVTNITTSRTVYQGFSASINVTVANQGGYTETFNVTCFANATIIGTLTGITLTSGSSTTVTFIWNTSGIPVGNYTISAYAWPVPSETDTTDNTFTDGTIQIVQLPWSSPTGGGGRPAYVW